MSDWRDAPERVALARAVATPGADPGTRLVLADWLEEHGRPVEAFVEWASSLPEVWATSEADVVRFMHHPPDEGAWRALTARPPADEVLAVFPAELTGCRRLAAYQGRCGVEVPDALLESPAGRAALAAIPRLEYLRAWAVSWAAWQWLTANLPGLTHLALRLDGLSPDQAREIWRLTALRSLTVWGRLQGGADALAGRGRLLRLRRMVMDGQSVSLGWVRELEGLEELTGDVRLTGGLPRLPELRALRVRGGGTACLLTDVTAKRLWTLSRLERVEFTCARLGRVGLAHLAALRGLREITLSFPAGARVPSLAALAGLPLLESLTIDGIINDGHLDELARCRGLRRLNLSRLRVTNGLKSLAGLPLLEEVKLAGRCTPAAGVLALAGLPRLLRLDIHGLWQDADTGPRLVAACPAWVRVEYLSF
jgi:uncharacterized protein (TIGR02996 family)